VAAAIGAYESIPSAEQRADYELNQKPFLEPLSHLVMVSTTDGGQMVQHLFLYVK